jgi:hypothetical protein
MKVYSAIASVMSDLSKIGIGKEKKNSQQGFMYRGVDDVMNALAPIISKHGLVILPRVVKRDVIERQSKSGGALFYVTLDMEFDFVAAEDGSKHVVGPIVGEAMDSGDKASNKAMSVAYKYACFQAFCIPTEAEDPDSQAHDVSHRWDGKVQVGFSKNYKDALWRDIPQDFLDWCNDPKNKLGAQAKEYAKLEQERRTQESQGFDKEMPESFYQGLKQ